MARTKIDYGIDLGTTNSAISLMENGEIRIIKSDKYQKDTTPSCVQFNKKKAVFVGDDALNRYRYEALKAFKAFTRSGSDSTEAKINTFIEFKRTMGTDKSYPSEYMNQSFASEELSAEVLKKLKSYLKNENITAAIITVPAKFRQNQIDATQRAATLAGFNYFELLQEPIAASLAYGIDAKDMDGHWLVFDLGGGTFDAALMKVEEGVMKVADTEGDNHLGGKNIDYAIVDKLLIPYLKENYTTDNILSDERGRTLLRDALKWIAEETKIVLSAEDQFEIYTDEPLGEDDNGEDMELDLTVTLDDYENAARPIFQRAIDISVRLLENNKLKGSDLKTVVLVGGPTLSQTLRNMLTDSLFADNDNKDSQIFSFLSSATDPMTAVAKGAALFASTRDIPLNLQKRDRTKIQLTLKFPETTVETEENIGIRIERSRTTGQIPKKIFAEIIRNDQAWSGGKVEIQNDAEIVPIILNTGKTNGFAITLSDEQGNIYPCEPSQFTIIQGLKAATPTLPFALCIDAYDTQKGKQTLQAMSGLDKNQSLPAKGQGIFKTQKKIHAGNKQDVIRIPIYEGDPGTQAIHNNQVHEVLITGEDLPEDLPEDMDAELMLEIDSSRRMKLSAYFPYIDETYEIDLPDNTTKDYDADVLENEIQKARQHTAKLENISPGTCGKSGNELNELAGLLKNAREDQDTKTQVKERLSEVLKDLDKTEEEGEWQKTEQKLTNALKKIAVTCQRYGNENTTQLVNQYQEQAHTIIRERNVKLANALTEEIRASDFALVSQDIGLWISYIRRFDEEFDKYHWKDRVAARQLISEAKQIIMKNPSKTKLQHIVKQLSGILSEADKPLTDTIDKELLRTKR
ncbi:Hsp70 family protein [Desulfonema magnum]|uniref:Chaperone protein DnaK-like domain-containing protein n=1 Tax=Desulfonema magnum TaxID=45655 RepID=A0A975BN66_9BACT|nr:Hsp70 family protein [Desulfonema magnum]QTA88535.1 Chaperone protein DnaK-like domain-containing protein [Desulfonema magnum]